MVLLIIKEDFLLPLDLFFYPLLILINRKYMIQYFGKFLPKN